MPARERANAPGNIGGGRLPLGYVSRKALPCNFYENLFDGNERDIQKYRKVVEQINALEPQMKRSPMSRCAPRPTNSRTRVAEAIDAECERRGKDWEELTRDDKRAVTDAALDPLWSRPSPSSARRRTRTLKMRPFDVQLIGGMVLHDGRIAEMKTGEGKTLTATLPIYLNALTGKGVHLVTVNDYLSKVGAVAMGPLYHFLGLSVGIIQGQSPETGDIGGTYIFDPEYRHPDPRYDFARPADVAPRGLRLRHHLRHQQRVRLRLPARQPGRAGAGTEPAGTDLRHRGRSRLDSHRRSANAADYLRPGRGVVRSVRQDGPHHPAACRTSATTRSRKSRRRRCSPTTASGASNWRSAIQNLSDSENLALMQHANAALRAHAVYKRDIDYLVKKNEEGKDEVVIIDENTGRLMFGRRWWDGLHQAVEAKEGVKIENENQTLATITFQNLFRLYPKLGGMTGTAKTEEDEFRKIYALDVVVVPTNKPMIRKDHPDIIFKSEEAKLRGIAREILTVSVAPAAGAGRHPVRRDVRARLRPPALRPAGNAGADRPPARQAGKRQGAGQGQVRRVERPAQPQLSEDSSAIADAGQADRDRAPLRDADHACATRATWTRWRSCWRSRRRTGRSWKKR